MDLIYLRKNNFIRIHHNLEFMHILKLIMKFDKPCIVKKTTNSYNHNPVNKTYFIVSELIDVLQSWQHCSIPGYENIDWFVDEVMKL